MRFDNEGAEDDDDEDDDENDVKEMTKQRQQVGDQEEAVDGLAGRKVNSIGRINSINSNACHCPDASRTVPAWLLAYKLCGQGPPSPHQIKLCSLSAWRGTPAAPLSWSPPL